MFSETLFWMCDGGRYSAPFSGRVTGVLGAEEITGYFWDRDQAEHRAQPHHAEGIPDVRRFHAAARPQDFRLIMATIPVAKDFRRRHRHRAQGREDRDRHRARAKGSTFPARWTS